MAELELRPAVWADADSLHAWRNAPEVRASARTTDPIPRETHQRWLRSVLDDPRRPLLIGEVAGEPVGVLRLDIEGTVAEVSIYLVPGKSGQGFGTALLRALADWTRRHRPEVRTLRAAIKPSNAASLRAFEKAGYEEVERLYEQRLQEP